MSPELQPVHREAATLQRLEALLDEAIGIADDIGLDLTAIRIAEAMTAIRERNGGPAWDAIPLLN